MGTFFGRETELETLREQLTRRRLVTILGAPGVGKSALAARLSEASARETFVHVDCARLERGSSDEDLRGAVRAAIVPQATDDEAVGRHLGKLKRPIVWLDDADALGGMAPSIVSALLRCARDVRCLVTTRERLRLSEEAVVPLSPFELPDETADPDEAREFAAVGLFVDLASAADARFRLDASSARAVTALVRAAEGLPLTIVLAAARMATFDVSTLAASVGVGAPFLDTSSDVSTRARSTEGCVASSLDALDPLQRDALVTLALFPGQFSLEDAIATLAEGASKRGLETREDATRIAEVATVLEALRDRSLLEVTSPSAAHTRRFSLLRSVRDTAVARQAPVHVRAWYTRLAALSVERVAARGGPLTLARGKDDEADLDTPGLVRAFELAREDADLSSMASLVLGTTATFLGKGPLSKLVAMLDEVLESSRASSVDESRRADLSLARGQARLQAGSRDRAIEDFQIATRHGSVTTRAFATSKLALVTGLKGRHSEAHTLFDEARRLLVSLGGTRPDLEGRFHKDEANVYAEEGRDEAYGALLTAKACFDRSGEPRESAFVGLLLATRLCDDGKLEASRRACDECIGLFQTVGDERSSAWAFTVLGLVEQESQAFGMAREHLARALAVARKVGDRHTEGLVLAYVAGLELEIGDLEEAVSRGEQAVRALESAGDRHGTAVVRAVLAVAFHKLGRFTEALETAGSARGAASDDGREARRAAVEVLTLLVAPPSPGTSLDAAVGAITEGRKLVEELRFARRIVMASTRGSVPLSHEIVVGPQTAWVRAPAGTFELAKRPVLRRLFQVLAKERTASPGKPVTSQRLVRHLWPSEKIVPRAAMNRLYVAVTRLREDGLGSALAKEGDGYLLRPDVAFRIARPGESKEGA